MDKTITLARERSFIEELSALPGGEGVRLCIQCGTCTGSCPNANKMDFAPREVIALTRAGLHEEVLSSNSMWFCASCYLCTVRCPRDIKPTDLMHALECLAVRYGVATKRTRTPVMYRSFTDSMKSSGRVHELGFMAKYFLRTNPLEALKMTSLGSKLFFRGRMPISGKKIKGTAQLKAILDKAKALGGAI